MVILVGGYMGIYTMDIDDIDIDIDRFIAEINKTNKRWFIVCVSLSVACLLSGFVVGVTFENM